MNDTPKHKVTILINWFQHIKSITWNCKSVRKCLRVAPSYHGAVPLACIEKIHYILRKKKFFFSKTQKFN